MIWGWGWAATISTNSTARAGRSEHYRPGEEENKSLEIEGAVIGQDLRFVESQRPEELPVDLSAELQIAGVDRVAIEYRRWLREIAKGSESPSSVKAISASTNETVERAFGLDSAID